MTTGCLDTACMIARVLAYGAIAKSRCIASCQRSVEDQYCELMTIFGQQGADQRKTRHSSSLAFASRPSFTHSLVLYGSTLRPHYWICSWEFSC